MSWTLYEFFASHLDPSSGGMVYNIWEIVGTYATEFDARSQYYYLANNGVPGNYLKMQLSTLPAPSGLPPSPPSPGPSP